MSRSAQKKAPLEGEAPFRAFDANVQNFLSCPLFASSSILGHTLTNEHFADVRLLQSLGDYLPSGNLLKRSDNSSTVRTSLSGRMLGPQAAGFDDPVEFRLALQRPPFPVGPYDLQSTWPLRPAALNGSTYNL